MTVDSDNDQHSWLVSLLGKLDVTMGHVSKAVERANRIQETARRAEQPRSVPFAGSGIVPANGVLPLSPQLGPVPQGYTGHLLRLSVGGLTPTTAAAGRADLFLSAMSFSQVTDLSQVALADWCDESTSLPNVTSYGKDVMVLHAGERVHVVFSGATAGQEYVIAGMLLFVQESATQQVSSV